jgi:hypothetical protein
MIGVITSEKSGSFERMGMQLYIWMRPGLIRIMPLTACGYQLMVRLAILSVLKTERSFLNLIFS